MNIDNTRKCMNMHIQDASERARISRGLALHVHIRTRKCINIDKCEMYEYR